MRRAYLELAGRIPTHDEAVKFLSARGAAKRSELVDRLLESPDYVSHFYNWWADILRLVERPQKQFPFEPYLFSVKEAIRTNKPYDEWMHELLTADGRIWENPAVGFQLRDQGMPLPYVDTTVRVPAGAHVSASSRPGNCVSHVPTRVGAASASYEVPMMGSPVSAENSDMSTTPG